MAKREDVLEVEGISLGEFTRDYAKYGDQLNKFVWLLRSLNAAVVQAGNDLISRRAEVASAKADLEKIRKECEIRHASVNSNHQDLVNQITKERMELAAEKRRLEFVASELNRKAVAA